MPSRPFTPACCWTRLTPCPWKYAVERYSPYIRLKRSSCTNDDPKFDVSDSATLNAGPSRRVDPSVSQASCLVSSFACLLYRAKNLCCEVSSWSRRSVIWSALNCVIGFVTYVLPGAFGSGIYRRKNCACGERRLVGIWLFANCVRVATPPTVVVVSGSKIGARPLKSPWRCAADGTLLTSTTPCCLRWPS